MRRRIIETEASRAPAIGRCVGAGLVYTPTMGGWTFGVAIVLAVIGNYVLLGVGKRVGDELAAWVIANEENDDARAPAFGVAGGETTNPTLSESYGFYARRYMKIRRARGEDVSLGRRYQAITFAQGLLIAVVVVPGVLHWLGWIELT